MDETKMEKFYNAVRILMKEQKVNSLKMTEMEKKLDANEKYISKLEKDLDEEKKETDKRFDSVLDRFESLGNVIEEHTDGIEEIEEKVSDLKNKLEQINGSLERINVEISKLESKEKHEEKVVNCDTFDDEVKNDNEEIKQCRFDRVGYCFKGKDECNFLHVEETCELYLQNGYCNKITCIRRHPRECYFYERGFCRRNGDCSYLHRSRKNLRQCDKCDQRTNSTYYCEICDKSYCSHCTIKEAHVKDLNQSKNLTDCKNVHI